MTVTQPKVRRKAEQGRLASKDEKIARALANPANFGEMVLGFTFSAKQREALELCLPPGAFVSLACCNGGGKTSRVLVTLVLWHMFLFPAGKVKVTSGSYPQIEDQIWPQIIAHKEKFPLWKWFETPYIDIPSNIGGGFFRGFTTNHPGRAEGDHEDGPDKPLLFIVDEAKTAPEWLKKVLVGRVRATRTVLMSSHGFAEGWFYETQAFGGDRWKKVQINWDDCPWITKEEKENVTQEFAGQPEFINSVAGFDFMPLVQDAIINGKALDECIANPPPANKNGERHLFCDFAWSGSGDQNVLALREGNVITIEKKFHCGHLIASAKHQTPGIVEQFIAEFLRLGLQPNQISGDEGGGGKLIMDELDSRGWILNRVNNGATASDSEHYVSVGAEIWYEAGKHITNKTYVLPRDMTFRAQALSRKRKKNDKGKLAVETKEEMRMRGVSSPDAADAVFGAMMPSHGWGSRGISWAQAAPVSGGRDWSGRELKW